MSLLVKAKREGAEIVRVTPQSAGWNYVGFAAYRLAPDEEIAPRTSATDEVCVVILSGTASVKAEGQTWRELSGRSSVERARAPLLPRGNGTIRAHAERDRRITRLGRPRARAPDRAQNDETPAHGEGLNQRFVCDILPQTEAADHLLVVEVVTPGGHSCSYPPHSTIPTTFRSRAAQRKPIIIWLRPARGFAQRVYSDDRSLDEALAVEDHDVVMVPRGYHPVVVPYGYDSDYLNVMAGPTREWHFKNDPAHEWLLQRSPTGEP
jgi:5-deoxy-glucuronate isomerase